MENPLMNDSTGWTLTVDQDPATGDCILQFPDDLLAQAGWKEGDVLVWTQLSDSSWSLSKKPADDHTKALVDPV